MTPELNLLCLSVFLGLAQLVLGATAGTLQRGLSWNASARDTPVPPLSGKAGRLDRALQNFKETFPFFLAAILLVQVTNHNGGTSLLGAQLYFWARLIYVPVYFFGIPFLRTGIWTVSIVGILMVLTALA